ncbi:hypothetical protein ACF06D_15655 [Streptomyces griseoluteus]|uniref:hypothetical protein n=1 Tax=Streptomyces TaxID=1883 RepID=UPI000A389841|nr:hypothetical protein [Streptomyces recifensis]
MQTDKLRQVFAQDLPVAQTDLLGATQRPIALSAFAHPGVIPVTSPESRPKQSRVPGRPHRSAARNTLSG